MADSPPSPSPAHQPQTTPATEKPGEKQCRPKQSGTKKGEGKKSAKPNVQTASSSSDISIKLDLLLASVSRLQGDNEKLGHRLTSLEAAAEQDSTYQCNEASAFGHENFEDEIQDRLQAEAGAAAREQSLETEEDFCPSFDAGVVEDLTGPSLDDGIAARINEGLLLPSDRARLKNIMQTHARPANVESLRTPQINPALQVTDGPARRRDRFLSVLQEQVGCSLKIVAGLMSDIKGDNMDRQIVFEKLADAARLLLASHKDLSQQRRESLRPALNTDYRTICGAKQNQKLTSNEFLFGEDLPKRAEEAMKAKRLSYKLTSTGSKNGNRGRQFQSQTRPQLQQSQAYRGRGNYHYQSRYPPQNKRPPSGQSGGPAMKYPKK
jgi:hypothetical protein